LRTGTTVNVTFLVGSDVEDTINTCRRLAEAAMRPVAHMPARGFASLTEVEEYCARLQDVGCKEALVLGGGNPEPVGNLTEAMDILESGLLQKYGFSRIGVAAHPEGHPDVPEEKMTEALLQKAEWAKANGIDLYYATQFCFEPAPIITWERRMRGLLTDRLGTSENLPQVHLGVAGPAKIAMLIKFALMSGVGPSVRFVTKYTGNVFKLATTSAPDELVAGIAAHQVEDPECLVRGLHFYTFGGLPRTLEWCNQVAVGNFEVSGPASFQVHAA